MIFHEKMPAAEPVEEVAVEPVPVKAVKKAVAAPAPPKRDVVKRAVTAIEEAVEWADHVTHGAADAKRL